MFVKLFRLTRVTGQRVRVFTPVSYTHLDVYKRQEEHMKPALEPDTIVAHLDKSHVTVHTYPE